MTLIALMMLSTGSETGKAWNKNLLTTERHFLILRGVLIQASHYESLLVCLIPIVPHAELEVAGLY